MPGSSTVFSEARIFRVFTLFLSDSITEFASTKFLYMHTTPITVVVADEFDIFRVGLRAAIQHTADISIVGESNSAPELFGLLETLQPDVIFLDLDLPMSRGFDTLLQIRKAAPDAKVLLLGYELDPSLAEKLSKAGANGFLSRSSELAEVETAIRMVVSQGYFFSESGDVKELESVFRPISVSALRSQPTLTEKEVAVLRLICQEQSTRDIASSLSLSPRTIESIRDRIRIKTGSRNLAGLALFALKYGLIRLG
jgi:DNA-binding NarL/FixJ family response regulator